VLSLRHKISPRWGSRAAAAFLVALATVIPAAAAPAAPIADEAAVVYDPRAVLTADLTLSPEAIAALEAEPSEYVKGTFAMATTSGGPGGTETSLTPAPVPVEARLKGSGSFRPITGKAAFKLKFKKAAPFLGLRKMTLNNMVQDESMAHEALTYLAFAAVEAPAPRSGYAYLRLNGEDVGLYADVETLDKVALEKRFGAFVEPPQHLYEGEGGDDLLPGKAEAFEVDEGEEADRTDLEALIGAVEDSSGAPWSDQVGPFADLDEMSRMWALERYVAHWDGYAGHFEPGLRPNNYYLFSDPGGRFQMLPWGADQTWDLNLEVPHRIVSFDGEGGVMFNRCLANEACFRAYWEALDEVTDAVEAMEAGPFLAATAAMLAPWQQQEREFGRAEATEAKVTAAVTETAAFIADRPAEAREWLAANEPPPLPLEEEPTPWSSTPTPPSPAPPLGIDPQPSLRLGQVERRGKYLAIHLGLATGGDVRVRATTGIAGRRVTACATSAEVAGRSRKTIACPLTKQALDRLERHACPLRLRVAFTPRGGEPTVLTRRMRLPAL